MIPEYKLGWVAGIIDFKGTVVHKGGRARAGGRPQLCLMVETKNLAIAEELCRLTGTGSDYHEARERKEWMRRGCITHCPEPDIEYPGQRDMLPAMGRWTVSGAAAIIVISAVQKYMISDNGISELYREARDHLATSGRGTGSVRKAVARLALLGWPIPRELRKIAPPVPLEDARLHNKAGTAAFARAKATG